MPLFGVTTVVYKTVPDEVLFEPKVFVLPPPNSDEELFVEEPNMPPFDAFPCFRLAI